MQYKYKLTTLHSAACVVNQFLVGTYWYDIPARWHGTLLYGTILWAISPEHPNKRIKNP